MLGRLVDLLRARAGRRDERAKKERYDARRRETPSRVGNVTRRGLYFAGAGAAGVLTVTPIGELIVVRVASLP